MSICCHDWKDFMDKQERITVALEKIADAMDEQAKIAAVTKDILQQTAALQAALPKVSGDAPNRA